MWAELNKLTKSKENKTVIRLQSEDGEPIPDSQIPTHINNFFSTIGPKLADKFGSPSPTPQTSEPQPNTPTLTINTITSTQLYNEIKKINIYKSSGIDGISSRIIKDAMLILLEEFTYLFNQTILTGTVPHAWKIATVIPIPKIANSPNVSDLRPISLLPLPGKILEKFIHNDLMTYLNNHNLLSDSQFGFRPALSTTDAIATLIDDIGLNYNNSMLTLTTYIHFSKAFDTLNHEIL